MRPVAIPALLRRLASVASIRINGGDDPIRGDLAGDLAGDPPAPIGPIRTLSTLSRLHILACHQRQQRQQRHRSLLLLIQLGALQRRDQRGRVVDQRRHQRILGGRVVPVDLRLARGGVVVAAAHRCDLGGRAGHLPPDPADRGDQLGDGVLGGDRIGQDRGVHRPPPPTSKHPGLLHHPPDRLVDPLRPRGAGQPLPPVGQRGRMKPPIVQGHPSGDLPAQITAGRLGSLGSLGIRQVIQALQGQNGGRDRRGQRRAAPTRGEQVRELLVGEHLAAMGRQKPEHAPLRHQMPHQRLSIEQLPVGALHPLHAEILLA
jgi:hypothetical protein